MKYIALIVTLLGSIPAQAWQPPTLAERAIVEHAIRYSPLTIERFRDPFALLEVLRIETHPDIRVPDEFRGSTLAVSYRESVWATGAIGDGGRAKGWAQMHRWHHKACNFFDRSSPTGSMRCWLMRVRDTYRKKVWPRCRREGRLAALRDGRHFDPEATKRAAWIASWRWVAKGGNFPGCTVGKPRLHLSQLLCWQRGERHRGICKGYRGGWEGDLRSYMKRQYGDACNTAADQGVWSSYE